jgi:hypothetical protein
MKLEFSWQILEKFSNTNFMEVRPVGDDLFLTDRQTDMTKLIVAFLNFSNTPKSFIYIF